MNIRDLASFIARFVREQNLAPIDAIGFSLGGWVAAEMAANDPGLFSKLVLVAPVGIRPPEGEIKDLFTVPALIYLRDSVRDFASSPEFSALYDGGTSPEQYEAFEDARAETARLAWQPYMFNPSLPHLLEGTANNPTLDSVGTRRSHRADFSVAGLSEVDEERAHVRASTDAVIGRKSKSHSSSSNKCGIFSDNSGRPAMHIMWFTERQYHYDPETEPERSTLLESQILRNRSFFGLPNANFDAGAGIEAAQRVPR